MASVKGCVRSVVCMRSRVPVLYYPVSSLQGSHTQPLLPRNSPGWPAAVVYWLLILSCWCYVHTRGEGGGAIVGWFVRKKGCEVPGGGKKNKRRRLCNSFPCSFFFFGVWPERGREGIIGWGWFHCKWDTVPFLACATGDAKWLRRLVGIKIRSIRSTFSPVHECFV